MIARMSAGSSSSFTAATASRDVQFVVIGDRQFVGFEDAGGAAERVHRVGGFVGALPTTWLRPLCSAASREAAECLDCHVAGSCAAIEQLAQRGRGRTDRFSTARSTARRPVHRQVHQLDRGPAAACNGVRRSAAGPPRASSASTVVSQFTVAECAVISRSRVSRRRRLAATASALM